MRYDISFEFPTRPAPSLQEINKYFISSLSERRNKDAHARAQRGTTQTRGRTKKNGEGRKSNINAFAHSCSHTGLGHYTSGTSTPHLHTHTHKHMAFGSWRTSANMLYVDCDNAISGLK